MPYKPQIYQRGRRQNCRQFNRGSNWRGNRSFDRNRGYGRGRGNFWRGTYRGRGNF